MLGHFAGTSGLRVGGKLAGIRVTDYLSGMSTVPVIEATIEKLPAAEFRELITWIEDYAAAIGGSETLFAMYDAEEEQNRAKSEAR